MDRHARKCEHTPERSPVPTNLEDIPHARDANVKPITSGMSPVDLLPGRRAEALHGVI